MDQLREVVKQEAAEAVVPEVGLIMLVGRVTHQDLHLMKEAVAGNEVEAEALREEVKEVGINPEELQEEDVEDNNAQKKQSLLKTNLTCSSVVSLRRTPLLKNQEMPMI